MVAVMVIEEIFQRGGPVVFILAGYSLLAVTITLERLLFFLALPRPPRGLEEALRHSDDPAEVVRAICGPEGTLLQAIIVALRQGVDDLTRVAIRVGSEELQRMERGFRTLAVLASTATLLGLFGTITGMIKAFMVIEQAGGRVDAQALAGGIWEAMITTGVGLAVAIPITLLLNFLEGLADRRAQSMRAAASLLLERLGRNGGSTEVAAVHHREAVVRAV